jgi:serine/threonine-protein kinase
VSERGRSTLAPAGKDQADKARVVGRYLLGGELGRGGMAVVHVGRLTGAHGFSRIVAIKKLSADFARDRRRVEMFTDEAVVSSRIRHPNVVSTLDVVRADGELLLVMDYVHGESLSSLLRASEAAGRWAPVPIVTSIVAGALEGLHAAHEAVDPLGRPLEVVHRDVSPHNVMVGVDGVARLIDFGIAKATSRTQASTGAGFIKGKIGYMAPEQLEGRGDRRTDVYGAAMVLWEALAGRRAWDGVSRDNLFARILAGVGTKPSTYNPHVPRALDAIVMRGLSVDPKLRYPTARAMAVELDALGASGPPREVADWVATLAAASLRKRGATIRALEDCP